MLKDHKSESSFPTFFNIFLKTEEEINVPEPVNGDTVLHIAYKKGRINELLAMMENKGNPFIKNKRGETIANYLESESCRTGIYEKLKEKVKELQNRDILKREDLLNEDSGVNFTNILLAFFTSADPKSVKDTDDLTIFLHFGYLR